MARKNQQKELMAKWWVRVLVGLAFLAIAYGFASLAIDSGNLLEYVVTIAFAWWAIHHIVYAVRFVFSHR